MPAAGKPKYKRILLKLSGEMLAGPKKTGIDADSIAQIAQIGRAHV